MSVESILAYRAINGLTDTDFVNLVTAVIDDKLFKILGLYIEDPVAYDIYEALYRAMGLQDLVRWFRGEEIAINSLQAYLYAVVLEWIRRSST